METSLADRISRIRATLARAGEPWGGPALLIAVTKTHGPERINPLKDAGVLDIGENRVQEWLEKQDLVDSAFRLHIIGQLQSNKVKYIIERACLIHSLDRASLAEEIDRQARRAGKRMQALVEVNIAGEDSKAGLPPAEVAPFIRQFAKAPGLCIAGLMTVLPQSADPERVRPWCREMRRMFDELRGQRVEGADIRHLSMGMSGDFEVAAQEGATMVRVGSAIFGARG